LAVRDRLLDAIEANANADDWGEILQPYASSPTTSLHLAILVEPYLSFILDGSKTVESRFSVKPIAPHGRVAPGDTILLKPPGKPIVGCCSASAVWDYELDEASWSEIRSGFAGPLRAQDGFWESRMRARFATLIRVDSAREVSPLVVPKRDRRGWVVLAAPRSGGLF
jgi:hypothetical protein